MTKAEYNHKQLKHTTMGLNVLSYLCFFISASFTIMLMWDSAAIPLKQVLNVIMAICLEVAKVYFFRFLGGEIASKGHENLPGKVALWVLTIFLFVASTFGSIHYYMKTSSEQSLSKQSHDSGYTALESDVISVDAEIKQLLEVAASEKRRNLVTKSKETLEKVDVLRKLKAKAISETAGYKSKDTSDDFFNLLATFFGCKPEAAKGGMYLFLSILLEFCGIASAFYGAFSRRKMQDMEYAGLPDTAPVQKPRMIPVQKPTYDNTAPAQAAYASAMDEIQRRPAGFTVKEPESKFAPRKSPVGSAIGDDVGATLAKMRASLNRKPDTGYSLKSSKSDVHRIYDTLEPDTDTGVKPVTSTGTGKPVPVTSTGPEPVTGIKLKTKVPVPVPESEDDVDIDGIVQAYITALFPVKADGSLTGRAQVARKLEIPDDLARVVHMRLKKASLITVDGSKSFPNCSKDEMLSAMTGGAA